MDVDTTADKSTKTKSCRTEQCVRTDGCVTSSALMATTIGLSDTSEWSLSQPNSSARAIVAMSCGLPVTTNQFSTTKSCLLGVCVCACVTFRILVGVCDVLRCCAADSLGVNQLSHMKLVHSVRRQSPVAIPLVEDDVAVHLEEKRHGSSQDTQQTGRNPS